METQIVITTLQKFPFVLRGLLHVAEPSPRNGRGRGREERAKAGKRRSQTAKYAVIVDEAHSSQTGETARELKAILGREAPRPTTKKALGRPPQPGHGIPRTPAQPELLAFTATPKGKTLELFGQAGPGGLPEPFSTCTACARRSRGVHPRRADQLHTTYAPNFKLSRRPKDDRTSEEEGGAGARQVHDPAPLQHRAETEVMVEHFRRSVGIGLGGRAKAMVVTSSRSARGALQAGL